MKSVRIRSKQTAGHSCRRVWGHVPGDDRIRPYNTVIAYLYFSDDLRPCPDHDIVADLRCPSHTAAVADSHPLIDRAVSTDFDGRMEDDTAKMVNPESPAYPAGGRDRDPRCYLDESLA